MLAVGNATLFGSLARQIADTTTTRTSFDKGVSAVSWLLIRFMACMVPIVFFINGFTKGDWVEAALFALSVAVGLTPEMLPTVVSANLVRGAAFMARKRSSCGGWTPSRIWGPWTCSARTRPAP